VSVSGARQWRHDCRCAERNGVAQQRHTNQLKRMHSQVTRANLSYFVVEDRVGEEVSEADLRRILNDLEDGQALIVCNVCGAIRVVDK